MADMQETLDRHIEDIAGIKADIRWLTEHHKGNAKQLAKVEIKVNNNQKMMHGAMIALGIVLTIFTALSPILKPVLLEAIK